MLSQDEDRLVICQQQLQAVANAESDSKTQATGEADDSSETSEKDEHDVDCEAESQISESSTEASAFMPPDEMTIQRILNLEKKVEGILQQLAEKNKERTSIDRSQSEKYHEMQTKISSLEKVNKALSDENVSLRLENLEIKMSKMVEKKFVNREDGHLGPSFVFNSENKNSNETQKNNPLGVSTDEFHLFPRSGGNAISLNDNTWEFPKRTVKTRSQQLRDPMQEQYKNRYSALAQRSNLQAWNTFEEGGPKRDQTQPSNTFGGYSLIQASNEGSIEKRPPNVYQGEASYADALRKKPALNEQQFQQRKQIQNQQQPAERWQGSNFPESDGQTRNQNARIGHQKPSVTIIGDSVLGNVKKKDINDEAKNVRCYVKSFPGAKVEDMKSYLQPTINLKPDGIIMMFGTNNLRTDDPKEIAGNIIEMAKSTARQIEHVAVGGIVTRADSFHLDNKRKEVNLILEEHLAQVGIPYISQDNIKHSHLDHWGLHPNFAGTHILTGNIINYLNNSNS